MSSYTPSLYAERYVKHLSGSELDEALQNGYFPTGVKLSTAIAARYDASYNISARLYLRAPISPPIFSKSKRKLLRKNSKLFQYEVRDFYCDEEINRLWKQFKSNAHNWQYIPNLDEHIFKGESADNFPSKLLLLRNEGQLVAFTVMFEGHKSLASLEAAYDLNYSKYSPGIYTMLLELKYAQSQKKDFYYPGFIYKDVPMFQYKRRLGGLQFFQLKTRQWRSFEDLKPDDWVYETMNSKIIHADTRMSNSVSNLNVLALVTFFPPHSDEAKYGLKGFVPGLLVQKSSTQTYLYYHPLNEEYIIISKESAQHYEDNPKPAKIIRTKSTEEALNALDT